MIGARGQGKAAAGSLLAALASLELAAPAFSEPEFWNWFEFRLPVLDRAPWTEQPLLVRVISDLRFGPRYPGLGGSFLRVGPVWQLSDGSMLALHGTVIPQQSRPDVWSTEYRLELEPTFMGRVLDWTWSDRHRLEYRVRPEGSHVRYRNLARLNLAPPGSPWIPYLWDEILVEGNADGFAQNRAEVGIGRTLGGPARLDVGLMWRARRSANSDWAHDAIVHTSWVFVPDVAPLLP
jgi:hypothetical protein